MVITYTRIKYRMYHDFVMGKQFNLSEECISKYSVYSFIRTFVIRRTNYIYVIFYD